MSVLSSCQGARQLFQVPFSRLQAHQCLGFLKENNSWGTTFEGGWGCWSRVWASKHLGQNQERGACVVAKKEASGKSWEWEQEKKAVGDWSDAKSSEYSCHQAPIFCLMARTAWFSWLIVCLLGPASCPDPCSRCRVPPASSRFLLGVCRKDCGRNPHERLGFRRW